jgi:hypothetical protein
MKRRAFIPSASPRLEDRIALSQTGLIQVAAMSPAVKQAAVLDLNGFVLGQETTHGIVHKLVGTAGERVSPLGPSKLTGFLLIPNSGAKNKHVSGFVTMTDAKGSIVLSIKGTVMSLGGTLKKLSSGQLTYDILGGTGAYKGATGRGKVLYGPGTIPQPGTFLLNFGNSVPPP